MPSSDEKRAAKLLSYSLRYLRTRFNAAETYQLARYVGQTTQFKPVAQWRDTFGGLPLKSLVELRLHLPELPKAVVRSIDAACKEAVAKGAGDENLAWAVLLEGAGRVKLERADDPQLRIVPVSGQDLARRFADPYHRLERWQFDARAGTLLDRRSGLMWMVCSAGRSFDEATGRCDGTAAFTFEEALALPAAVNAASPSANRAYRDWRLPNGMELASLIVYQQQGPAVSSDNALTAALRIDLGLDPGSCWSSSWVPAAGSGGDAFVVNFTIGDVGLTADFDFRLRARLVRHAR
jgi:hypothetical protein